MKFITAGITDKGLVRENNEDAYLIIPFGPENSSLLVTVADGLGGHAGGEKASEIICMTFTNLLYETLEQHESSDEKLFDRNPAAAQEFLRSAFYAANRMIHKTAAENPDLKGMGAVVTAGILSDGTLSLAHIGDTRCYLFRGGILTQITEDQTYVADLVKSGKLKRSEMRNHPLRHIVKHALGLEGALPLYTLNTDLCENDRILFCSDGLTEMLDDSEINSIMKFYKDIHECAEALLQAALQKGGYDNVTAAIADIT